MNIETNALAVPSRSADDAANGADDVWKRHRKEAKRPDLAESRSDLICKLSGCLLRVP